MSPLIPQVTEGKIDQVSHQMAEAKLWEEHADPAYHMSLFNAYGLLRKEGMSFKAKAHADVEEKDEVEL